MKTHPSLSSITLKNFLSFGPEAKPIELQNLNILIGPNGSGKSNLIEAFELLRSIPKNLADPIRDGGGVREWLWKGGSHESHATLEVVVSDLTAPRNRKPARPLRHSIKFGASGERLEIIDESIEEANRWDDSKDDVFFYYRFQNGRPVINTRQIVKNSTGDTGKSWFKRDLKRETIAPDQSVVSQRKDPDLYPEITALSDYLGSIQTFREWSFGRWATLRKAQPTDLPNDQLLPDGRNLGLVLNDLEHRGDSWPRINELCGKFLPRFGHISVKISSGTAQIYLHEKGLLAPIPGTRLSDGTMRFLCLLAILLNPQPAPLICIEEPELGLHPDAISLIADLIIEASQRTQLIVTTHSDLLIDALSREPETVLVCEQGHMGTEMYRLESGKLREWLEHYSLGELWMKGELGGVRW